MLSGEELQEIQDFQEDEEENCELPEETQKSVALAAMAENFGKTFSPAMLGMWLDLLEPYSPKEVRIAVLDVIESYEFKTIPPFAVLKKALDKVQYDCTDKKELQAIAEWGVLLQGIEDYGSYREPRFCPTTAYVVRLLGGWSAICNWTESSLDFKRRDFIALWKEAAGKEEFLGLGAGGLMAAIEQRQRENEKKALPF